MFSLFKSERLSTIPLDNFSAMTHTDTPEQRSADKTLWTSPDGKQEIGIWECTQGCFVGAPRSDFTEMCYLLCGELELLPDQGEPVHIKAGDVFMLPSGWTGRWNILETTRKLYMVTYS